MKSIDIGSHSLDLCQAVYTEMETVDVAHNHHQYNTNAVILVGCKVRLKFSFFVLESNQPFVWFVKILETGSRVAKGLEFSWKSWTNVGVLIAFLQEVSSTSNKWKVKTDQSCDPERDHCPESCVPEADCAKWPKDLHVLRPNQPQAHRGRRRDQGAGRPPEAPRLRSGGLHRPLHRARGSRQIKECQMLRKYLKPHEIHI